MIISAGFDTAAASAGTPLCEIIVDSTAEARIMQVAWYTKNSGNNMHVGIGKPAAAGVTPTLVQSFNKENPADDVSATRVQSAIAWGTPPTAPNPFLRRLHNGNAVAQGAELMFPRGIVIPASGTFVLWHITATGVTCTTHWVLDV